MNKSDYLNNLKNLNMQNKTGTKVLGKGISALLNNTPVENILDSSIKIVEVAINDIIPGKYQPRKNFNEEQLQELSLSIQQKGVLQPVLLRKAQNNELPFELVAGERRLRAAKLAKLNKIPAIIVNFNNQEALEIGLIENLQREDLNAIEEAEAFARLIAEFNYTHNDLATILGKSRSHITNYLRVLTLPKEIKELIALKKLNVGHAKIIVNYECPMELAEEIVLKKLSVRDVEQLIKHKKNKSQPKEILQDNFSKSLTHKLEELFKGCRIVVKATPNGSGYIKIGFKDRNKLQAFISD